jgi:hypothetical protein
MILAGPYLDIALTCRSGQTCRQQVPGEDPLDRVLRAHVECHPYGVRVGGAVTEAGYERNGPMLGNHKTEPELS